MENENQTGGIDHRTDLTIYKMVRNRLPFILDNANNEEKISNFTLEIMFELEPCFRVDKDLQEGDPTKIGYEENYSIPQRAIIADIVCVYILILQMVANATGVGVDNAESGSNKFMSSVKAGSVTVEWEQLDISKGSVMTTTGEKLMMLYKKSAIRKARAIGCLIDICDDCTLAVELMLARDIPTPRVIVSSGCGYNNTKTVERG